MFLSAILIFTIGSLLCAKAQSLTALVAFRVVQSVGGAMLLPVGRLSMMRVFPAERYLSALVFVAIPGLIGPLIGIGPTLGGWLVQIASWHWIFLINVPVGIVDSIATNLYMPDSRNPATAPFDLAGYLLLAIGMAALTISLDGLADLGLQHAVVIVLLVLLFGCFVAYGLHATRAATDFFRSICSRFTRSASACWAICSRASAAARCLI